MGRTSAPRRRVAVLSTATHRWSRRGREVLLGKQDLPESATAPMTNDVSRSCFLFQGFQVILHLASCFPKQSTVAGGVLIESFYGKPKATVMENTDACGLPLNENATPALNQQTAGTIPLTTLKTRIRICS